MSAPDHAFESTATMVADFIDRVLCATHATTADTLATTDLSISQLRMLFVLRGSSQPPTVNEVADGVALSVAATGRAADRLVAAGLVDRREDQFDRRMKRLSLTAEGQHLLETHFQVHADAVEELLGAMPAEVCARLHDGITAAIDYLPTSPDCTL